jgi:hypothetical protein
MNTRDFLRGGGGQRRPGRSAENHDAFMYRFSENPGSLNLLEPSGTTSLEGTIPHTVKKLPAFYRTWNSQEPAISSYPEALQSTPFPRTVCVKIYVNIIVPFMSKSYKCSLSVNNSLSWLNNWVQISWNAWDSSRRLLTAQNPVRSRVNLCEVCDGEISNVEGFSPGPSAFAGQYHFTPW